MTEQDNNRSQSILIIDDDVNNIEILKTDLEDEGYNILTAEDGAIGWDVLQKNKDNVGVILLDRMMPNMNGMEFMAKLRSDDSVAQKPVIMQTAAAEKSQVIEGIRAGVYYYLTKPYEYEVMLSIVRAAMNDYGDLIKLRNDLNQYKKKMHIVKESFFEVKTLDDIYFLSTLISSYYPDPHRVILGVSELLINAVEHGNLNISYDEKSRLLKQNIWEKEVLERQQMPEYANKRVSVHFKRGEKHIELRIVDDGKGFNWQNYLEISPDRATHSHGRGVALSKMMSFDSIEYKGAGNEVLCITQIV